MFLTEAANRGSISTGYDVQHSLKLEDANNEWLYRASPTAGNRKTYTFSFWIKRTEIGLVNASGNQFVIGQGQHGRMYFGGDYFQYRFDDGHDCRNVSRQFRDTSAWYHFVVAVDTNQSSSSNRVKLYLNGESLAVDDHDGGSFPDIQDSGAYFSTSYLTIGTAPFGGSYNSGDGDYETSGYLAEFCGIDGTAYAPTDFGEFDEDSGIWKPKDVSELTFGSEGFYLNFTNASNLGEDFSGNDNDFALSNLAAADQATDTPTNNFCTLNLQVPNYANTGGATEGGTFIPWSGVNSFGAWYGTQGLTKGKWYWESYIVSRSGSYGLTNEMGVHTMENIILTDPYYANAFKTSYYLNFHYGYTYAWDNGTKGSKNSEDGVPDLGSSSVGKWVGLAFNADDGEATWYLNGSQMGNANLDIYDLHDKMQEGLFGVPFFQVYDNDLKVNFGGYSSQAISSGNTDANGYGNFEYAVPSGYYAICSKNLAEFG